MRTLILTVALATSVVGCAGISRGTGLGGGVVTSGEERSVRAESGSDTNMVATNGSNNSNPTGTPAP